ncbi:MAG: M14 family metallopeptidase [Planctomycetota bacterium]
MSSLATLGLAALLLVTGLGAAAAQSPISGGASDDLLTTAERSGFAATTTHAEVRRLLAALLAADGSRRFALTSFGRSKEGRELEVLALRRGGWPREKPESPLDLAALGAAARADGRVRVLVQANIHGGEVEGKEVALILAREFLEGRHAEVLDRLQDFLVPLYNADGNDEISKSHRVSQNGPVEGVGTRENADGFDLNRDFIKAETPEAQALLGLYAAIDPHLMIDLHTTNGSDHAYHLTYAPCLSPNQDPDLARFQVETQLPELRREVYANHLFRTFDYGNFEPVPTETGWRTFDHRPRFATNYFGLRNRLAVLSEAYSYASFETRVRATRAFVLENLRLAHRHAERIGALCAAADARCRLAPGEKGRPGLGWNTAFAPPRPGAVLGSELDRVPLEGLGERLVVKPGLEIRPMPVQVGFVAERRKEHPSAWVVTAAVDEVARDLARHGIEFERLDADREFEAEVFEIVAFSRAARPFQGHRIASVEGVYARRRHRAPKGSLLVSARQPLARIAAQLLEPASEDSLTTWNRFDAALGAEGETGETPRLHPVVRILGP